MQLNRKLEIVMVEASPPVKARKIIYYRDGNFKKRLLPPAPKPKIDLEGFMETINSKVANEKKEKTIIEEAKIIGICDECGRETTWCEQLNKICLDPDMETGDLCQGTMKADAA